MALTTSKALNSKPSASLPNKAQKCFAIFYLPKSSIVSLTFQASVTHKWSDHLCQKNSERCAQVFLSTLKDKHAEGMHAESSNLH